MRLFIGIDIPSGLKTKISEAAAWYECRYTGRYAGADSYHITLAYIGECDEEMRNDAIEAMKECAGRFGPFDIGICGAGYFGKQEKAILHLVVDGGAELQRAADILRAALDERSLPYDRKPLIPHITLGRKVELTDDYKTSFVAAETFCAAGLTLFHSCRIDDVLKYMPIEFVRFGDGDGI